MGFLTNRLGWVPNLFTLGNLWLGFFSIIISLQNIGNPDLLRVAGGFIILAVLCDGLDGFAARLLNASSEVGAQLDSLADLTTFGIAPAALMYSLSLNDFMVPLTDRISLPAGMILAAIYPAAAAFRLARFNVEHDPDHFIGLPSPVAGLIIALMPLAFQERLLIPAPILIGLYVACAYLMVSTLRYSKVQVTMVRRFSPVRLAIVVVFLLSVLVFLGLRYGGDFSAAGLFAIIIIYIVSGLVTFILHLIQEFRV
ncbi:MAG: CDP-alcohol phosphatidyltransferase family protein [Leptospiraceae bacterium]|nr:CDP-alcohol phosphatidyltransferase family protein [Leptospiraceae bacterium]MCB1303866.1 CDP-alcohol phosphatidyltransferase family protein [Leptospiraceae bacterium]